MAVDSLSYVDDEGLVAQAQELDHAVLVESDATGCVGLVALAVDEDGRTLLIDALAVVTGGHPIIVLGHVGVHVLAVALVVHDGGVDDLVVVVAVAAGKGRRCDIDVIELGAGIGADAECLAHVQCAGGSLAVALALLADAILADEAAIGMINNKTTATRLIPVPGKKPGDMVQFGGLMGYAPVLGINQFRADEFIARGGKIPAPMRSLTN